MPTPSTPNYAGGRYYPLVLLPCGGDGKRHHFHTVSCMSPGCNERLLLKPGRSPLDITGIIKFAKQKGWFADKKGYALCPLHNFSGRSSSTLKPAQKRAAFLSKRDKHVAEAMRSVRKEPAPPTIVPLAKGEPMNMPVALPEPPREATREDKRRVRDFLDQHYDEEHQRYIKDWNDEKAAKKLNVPRAWVSNLREDLYGPDTSEASAARDQEVLELLAVASKLKEDALSIATRAEDLEKACRRALDK